MKGFRIPKEERYKFTRPLGKLISGTRGDTVSEVENILRNYLNSGFSLKLYTVGDIVTEDFLNNDFLKSFIKLSIIDEKTQRNKIKISFEEFFEETYEFKNPQGTIRKESFSLLKKIINSNNRTLLKITEGEEDLLVLPLVIEIFLDKKVKNLVFYGQPPITDSKNPIPEGIVLVDVNSKIQKNIAKLIKLMVHD
ncbi:MAG: DUF359 domain-containing protein [Promethearchaeota archaeon]